MTAQPRARKLSASTVALAAVATGATAVMILIAPDSATGSGPVGPQQVQHSALYEPSGR